MRLSYKKLLLGELVAPEVLQEPQGRMQLLLRRTYYSEECNLKNEVGTTEARGCCYYDL